MTSIPHLIFSRSVEEAYMLSPDGTCVEGPQCRHVVDFGSSISGKALPGLSRCVLCCRYGATKTFNECLYHGSAAEGRQIIFNPYCNMEGDYCTSYYLDRQDENIYNAISGPFIAYDPSHYESTGPAGVTQKISSSPKDALNWFDMIFNQRVLGGPIRGGQHISERPWGISICTNPKCKINTLTFVNKSCAEGFDNTVYDMYRDKLCCIKCNTPVTTVGAEQITRGSNCLGRRLHLKYGNKWYSRCAFCRTVVEFNKFRSPQSCDWCHKNCIDQAIESTKVCYYCSNPVGLSRRGGAQSVQVDDKTIYFCRQHRINGPTRTYTTEEFKALIG